MANDAVIVLIAYLLGSIPFAFLLTRLATGKDIRFEGEGNVGARNVLHVAGPLPGVLTCALDVGKGTAAYWVARTWGQGEVILYLSGLAVVLGHGFPIWLGWRGGKGLAASFGFMLPMWPYSVLATGIVFALARMLIPDFNRSFAVAGTTFPLLTIVEGNTAAGFVFIILLLGCSGAKKILDLPHERATRAKSGWVEGVQYTRRQHHRNAS